MSFFDEVFSERDAQRREQSVAGIAIAIVTGRMGDGTYELRYLGMGGNAPSAPARMMMPCAGSQRGMYWMPETGDEVVVGFEGGDSNAPIILGALFNAQSPTPAQAKPSGDNHVRTLVSRSGHEVTMDDTPGAGKVVVRTKDGRHLTLDDTLPGKITMETATGVSVVLDDAGGTLTLKAPLSITLESATVAVRAPAGIALSTTNAIPTSLVMVENRPYGLHVHGLPLPAPPLTPPVQF